MTPSLFDLPLRLGDAVALASILFDQGQSTASKPLTDDFRARIAARAAAIRFAEMTPFAASLERDPVHPSAFFLCVDGVEDQPLLLRIAPASTPSSGIFPNSILIGRAFVGAQEAVLNAVSFGPSDRERLLAFTGQINRAFLPQSFGRKPVILISSASPAETYPLAFEGFRRLLRATGQNLAAFAALPGQDSGTVQDTAVWAAIRAGWREGYALSVDSTLNVTREVRFEPGITREEALARF